ncbi:MAG: hypothetical protein IJG18_02150 [Kiritimatiellae bacterium]|nr:hypothetical protein [Kiritimatiellia bacterium]
MIKALGIPTLFYLDALIIAYFRVSVPVNREDKIQEELERVGVMSWSGEVIAV